MSEQNPRDLLVTIEGMVCNGRSHLDAWHQIRGIFETEPELLDLAPMFFVIGAAAHLSLATLEAAKLTEARPDSISLHWFLSVLEYQCNRESAAVPTMVNAGRSILEGLAPLRKRIKAYRDKVIAHHDRINLRSEFANEQRLCADELAQVFDASERIAAPLAPTVVGRPFVPSFTQLFNMPSGVEDLVWALRAAVDRTEVSGASANIRNIASLRRAIRSVREGNLGRLGDESG